MFWNVVLKMFKYLVGLEPIPATFRQKAERQTSIHTHINTPGSLSLQCLWNMQTLHREAPSAQEANPIKTTQDQESNTGHSYCEAPCAPCCTVCTVLHHCREYFVCNAQRMFRGYCHRQQMLYFLINVLTMSHDNKEISFFM